MKAQIFLGFKILFELEFYLCYDYKIKISKMSVLKARALEVEKDIQVLKRVQ